MDILLCVMPLSAPIFDVDQSTDVIMVSDLGILLSTLKLFRLAVIILFEAAEEGDFSFKYESHYCANSV